MATSILAAKASFKMIFRSENHKTAFDVVIFRFFQGYLFRIYFHVDHIKGLTLISTLCFLGSTRLYSIKKTKCERAMIYFIILHP